VLYSKNSDRWERNLIPRREQQNLRYKNPDNDPRGPWTSGDFSARNFYGAGTYPIICPSGRVIPGPPKGMYWRVSKETFGKLDKEGRVWWGKDGNNIPRMKRFLSEVKEGIVPETIWTHKEVGNTQEAKKELLAICDFEDSASVFITPKPTRLIRRILEIATDKDSLILDSFAGSGTTGHSVLNLNKEDDGNRRFILVEMDENISRKVTAQRLTRAINGFGNNPGLGGGFRYCTLGEPLFDETGNIRPSVSFTDLAAHVFFSETGAPIPKAPTEKSPFLGIHNGLAIYLLFNGVMGDKRPTGGNVLTLEGLGNLPKHDGPKIVFGEGCRIGDGRLKKEGIIFKQIPYDIKVN